jgi:hypothetical protein
VKFRPRLGWSAASSLCRPRSLAIGGGLSLLVLLASAGLSRSLLAADHNDPGRVQATSADDFGDPAADIADIFVWHDDASVMLALTWRIHPAHPFEFDPDVLYGIHVDNDDDQAADYDIHVRYGWKKDVDLEDPAVRDDPSIWAVKIENVPGCETPMIGAIGETLGCETEGVKAMVGLFDDPFFFDLDGFFNGLSVALDANNPRNAPHRAWFKGDPWELDRSRPFGFRQSNDSFAGTNVHAVVLQIPRDAILKTRPTLSFGFPPSIQEARVPLHVWATTGGAPGRAATRGAQ